MSRRIDLLGVDFGPSLLGSLGFSSRCISHHFSLTNGQISYRLRKGDIRRKDYRDGDSPIAQQVLRCVGRAKPVDIDEVANLLRKDIQITLKDRSNNRSKVVSHSG